MKIAFIGFGEAAQAFTKTLARNDRAEIVSAFDIQQDEEIVSAACQLGVRLQPDLKSAIAAADWIISAVTADQSLAAVSSASDFIRSDQVFVDLNSVSPNRKRASAERLTPGGVAYLDMAVMASVHPRGHATPVLISGPTAAEMERHLEALGFRFEIISNVVGDATAIKMVRSMFVKGLEALTIETLIAAEMSSCLNRVIASLSETFPGLDWPDNAYHAFERTLRHGNRRAAEMRESAETYEELGLTGSLGRAIADVQQKMGETNLSSLGERSISRIVSQVAQQRHLL